MNTLNAATGIAATTITGFVAQLTGSFVVPFLVAVGVSAVGIVMYTAVIGEVRQLARPSWLQSGDTVDDSRSAAKALNHE
jgi:hypothetical protein